MTGEQDSERPWGSDAPDDLIEQGGGPGRFRWRPRRAHRWGKLTAGLAAAALVAGLAGGYLAGDAHGRSGAAAARSPARAAPVVSVGLAETGSQCSTALGHEMQLGIEVVNGSPEGMQLGQITARFPLGGLKLTVASWGPCGTLPFAHQAVNSVLPHGTSTWLTVTVTTLGKCPQGLPVEYVASYSQQGQTFTVLLPGFADPGVQVAGCPAR